MANFAFVDGHAKAMSLDVLGAVGYANWLNSTDNPY